MGRSSTTESRAAPTQPVILTFSGEAAGGDKEHRCLLKPQPKRVGHVYGSVDTTDTDFDSGKSPHCGCTSPLVAQPPHNHNGAGSPFMSERMRRTTGSAAVSTGDGASFVGTVANLVKVCMGTGSLALPYAFLNGGLGFSIVGVIAIGVWNYVACEKLLACKALLDTHSHGADDIDSNSTYAFVGRKAGGAAGAWMVHMSIVITLYGAGVMYLITAIGLLQDTPVSFLSANHPGMAHLVNTAVCVAIVLPLACARSVSFLAHSSLAGVIALAMAFAVIIGSAIWAGPQEGHQSMAEMWTVDVWPREMQSLAKFFGIASFCFGLPPLLFQIQGSMQQPQHFSTAMQVAVATVSAFYIAVAETVATLYSPQAPSNIIEVLPTSLLSTTVRLCVALVCLMSYPLAILPVGEMLDRTLEHTPCLVSTVQRRRLSFVPGLNRGVVGEGEEAWGKGTEGMGRVKQGTLTRVISRALLVVSSAVCATVCPSRWQGLSQRHGYAEHHSLSMTLNQDTKISLRMPCAQSAVKFCISSCASSAGGPMFRSSGVTGRCLQRGVGVVCATPTVSPLPLQLTTHTIPGAARLRHVCRGTRSLCFRHMADRGAELPTANAHT